MTKNSFYSSKSSISTNFLLFVYACIFSIIFFAEILLSHFSILWLLVWLKLDNRIFNSLSDYT